MRILKLIARVVLIILGLAVVAILVLGGLIAFDSLSPAQQASDFANVSYPGPDGVTLSAYLVSPDSASASPAILLVHEFYGLNESIVRKADLLAEQGYTVLAVDAYRGRSTGLIPRAIWLVQTTPREQIVADLTSGYDYLRQVDGVDSERIGAVGFCFGGTQVMHLGTQVPGLAATVIFYGSNPITDPSALGSLGASGPVLGIYGEEDRQIPLAEVYAFGEAMVDRDIRHRVSVYPDVGHAFVTYEAIFIPGPAQDAWEEMLEFLTETFQSQ